MPCLLLTERILQIANPVECPPWECGILLAKQDVLQAIAQRDYLATPVPPRDDINPFAHARRIAWLVVNGWEDAIEIDVGVPAFGNCRAWPVLDGNHRLYAAVIRGDAEIQASVSGSLDFAAELFGVDVEELLEKEFAPIR